MSPVDNTGVYDSRTDPQVQLQLSCASGGFKGWIGAKAQKFYASAESGIKPNNFTMSAGEVGASFRLGRFGVLANIQAGRGIGILTNSDRGDLKEVNDLLQGTWQATEKFRLGLRGGICHNRDDLVSAGDLKSNSNITAAPTRH